MEEGEEQQQEENAYRTPAAHPQLYSLRLSGLMKPMPMPHPTPTPVCNTAVAAPAAGSAYV